MDPNQQEDADMLGEGGNLANHKQKLYGMN